MTSDRAPHPDSLHTTAATATPQPCEPQPQRPNPGTGERPSCNQSSHSAPLYAYLLLLLLLRSSRRDPSVSAYIPRHMYLHSPCALLEGAFRREEQKLCRLCHEPTTTFDSTRRAAAVSGVCVCVRGSHVHPFSNKAGRGSSAKHRSCQTRRRGVPHATGFPGHSNYRALTQVA